MLPEKAREELRKAALTPIDRDPNARAKAIDRVLERLRMRNPECFQPEEDDHDPNDSPDQ